MWTRLRRTLSRHRAKRPSPPTLLYLLAGPPVLCPNAGSVAAAVFTFAVLFEGDQSGNGRRKYRDGGQNEQVVGSPFPGVQRKSLEGRGSDDQHRVGLTFSVSLPVSLSHSLSLAVPLSVSLCLSLPLLFFFCLSLPTLSRGRH